ncbi:MAG TPA: IPT/TIG domain-containing protein [Bryobacteraceae bacterium]|nr:IPT/TIG domain-containing protein [Bryobacteraceae bacterium]
MRYCFAANAILGLALLAGLPARAQISGSAGVPVYSSDGIVNAATQTVEALAPNTIATLYGSNLAFSTRSATASDIVRGALPTQLDGVQVWFNSVPCHLLFISPTQINFLIPAQIPPTTASIIVTRNGSAGMPADVPIHNASPGVFLWGDSVPLAVHLNGQLISDTSPAAPGEVVVIYTGGLGRTVPDSSDGQLATAPLPILFASQLQVLLNGIPCPAGSVLYVGLTPGFAGLYQINLLLPPDVPPDPEIQITVGQDSSPGSIRLPIQSFLAGAARNGQPAARVQSVRP